MESTPAPALSVPANLSRWGLRIRIMIVIGIVTMISLGTAVGDDRWWPFSPMSQYAFSVPDDGVINSYLMEAVYADGQLRQVQLSKQGIGLERAEMEGQLTRFETAPALMQTIAVMHARTLPDSPKLVTIYLRNRQTDLGKNGRQQMITLATWEVVHPENPGAGLAELRRRESWPQA